MDPQQRIIKGITGFRAAPGTARPRLGLWPCRGPVLRDPARALQHAGPGEATDG